MVNPMINHPKVMKNWRDFIHHLYKFGPKNSGGEVLKKKMLGLKYGMY
jgi:hypothetical protein